MAARGGRGRGRGRGHDALINPPPPPPVTMEQILGMQAQLMQAMMQRLDNEPARGPPPVQVRDKHGEFMKGRPPVFTHASDATILRRCCMLLVNSREQLRIGEILSSMDAPTMLLLSPGGNSRIISYHIISSMD